MEWENAMGKRKQQIKDAYKASYHCGYVNIIPWEIPGKW